MTPTVKRLVEAAEADAPSFGALRDAATAVREEADRGNYIIGCLRARVEKLEGTVLDLVGKGSVMETGVDDRTGYMIPLGKVRRARAALTDKDEANG